MEKTRLLPDEINFKRDKVVGLGFAYNRRGVMLFIPFITLEFEWNTQKKEVKA